MCKYSFAHIIYKQLIIFINVKSIEFWYKYRGLVSLPRKCVFEKSKIKLTNTGKSHFSICFHLRLLMFHVNGLRTELTYIRAVDGIKLWLWTNLIIPWFLARYNKYANKMSLIQIFNLAAYVVKGFLARSHDAIFIIRL